MLLVGGRWCRDVDAKTMFKLLILVQTVLFLAVLASSRMREVPLSHGAAISRLLSEFRPILDPNLLNKEIGVAPEAEAPPFEELDLTLVMASRNDGYGGNASHARAQLTLDMIDYHLGVHRSLKGFC